MEKGVAVFINPVAGHGRGAALLGSLRERIAADPHLKENVSSLQFTPKHGEEEEAKEAIRNAKTILMGGGDGTVHRMVHLIMDTARDKRLAVYPIGTGNDLHLSTGNHKPPLPEYLKHIIDDPVETTLDIWAINHRVFFFNSASFGLDARIVAAFEGALPRWRHTVPKKVLFFVLGLGQLAACGKRVRMGSETFSCIIMANLRSYAGGSVTSNVSSPGDGKFELIKVRSKWQYLKLVLNRVAPFALLPSEAITPPFTLELEPGMPVQVDGESYSGFFKDTSTFTVTREWTMTVCR